MLYECKSLRQAEGRMTIECSGKILYQQGFSVLCEFAGIIATPKKCMRCSDVRAIF
jgi:hypothetical protein